MTTWTLVDRWTDNADQGGDRQVSEIAYSVRYISERVTVSGGSLWRLAPSYREGTPLYPVVTICWYVVEADRYPGHYVVESETECDLVVDVHSPGHTEVWADCRYDIHGAFDSLLAATDRAAELSRSHSAHGIGWDGRSL